jgi:hypothetical protein
MNRTILASIRSLALLTSLASLTLTTAGAQGKTSGRTPWGDPDFQGTWTSQAELSVPFERPEALAGRSLLTDEEFSQREAQARRQLQTDNADFDPETADISTAGQVGSATSPPPHWLERGVASRRSSMVVDPPDGRIPPLTPEARRRVAAATARGSSTNGPFAGPEDLSLWDRCITRGLPSVIFPTVYNANARIVQSPGYLAITYEMIHETRVIPLDNSSHVSPKIRQYFGDSRGRWEGDTLVVDVSNFNGRTWLDMAGNFVDENEHVVERFTVVDADTILYEATVTDPTVFVKPVQMRFTLKRVPPEQQILEYSCLEGERSLQHYTEEDGGKKRREK